MNSVLAVRSLWLRRFVVSLALGCLAACPAIPAQGAEPLAAKIESLIHAPPYEQAHWGLLLVDLQSGETLYEKNPRKLFAPASVTKLYTVATALDAFGADYRFHTPLYRRGTLNAQGELVGDLILVASGDLSLGGRRTEGDELAFTDSDHIYANGASDASITPQNPLAGLDELARQAAAAGVKKVCGDVLIDDRLFEHCRGSGSGPDQVTPILVNDNVLDITLTPTAVGKPAQLVWRPQTAMFRVENRVETAAADAKVETTIELEGEDRIVVRGKIPAGHRPVLRIYEVPDPAAFARSLLIEALERAGIKIVVKPAMSHPSVTLPPVGEYAKLKKVGEVTSLPFGEAARVILKVSHNLHASTLPLLVAAHQGKRTLLDGMKAEREFLLRAGVDADTISFGGGAGGSRADYVTPAATVQLLTHMAARPDFATYERALPVLGVDGTLAKSVPEGSPVRGHVRAKTGTLVWENLLDDRLLLTSKALGGYITTKSGKRLAFAVFVNGVHLKGGLDSKRVGSDLGKLCEMIYNGLE
jgi:D-alanyl-D-alanine carboxypeptidase/D-alanyl-D-alanine-endopeptidase (penicillin-binding protein 4)